MERKRIEVNYNFNWADPNLIGIPIEQIEKDLEAMKKLGVTEVLVESIYNYGCGQIIFECFK